MSRNFDINELAARWESLRSWLDGHRMALLEMPAPNEGGHVVDRWSLVQNELFRLPGFEEASRKVDDKEAK